MTDDVIKQVPNILEKPILVMQSKQKGSRVVLFGEVYEANNWPVLAVLELYPTTRKGYTLDVIKIATAYGRVGNSQNLIDTSKIIYVDPDKNRTDSWLKDNRLQLPFGPENYGSIDMVSYADAPVNPSIRENVKIEKAAHISSAATKDGSRQQRNASASKQGSSPNRSQSVQKNSGGRLVQTASTDKVSKTDKDVNLRLSQKDTSNLRFSIKDSEGNTLSPEQQAYFKNSKVRDDNGNLLVMYHGTPYGGFTQFRTSSYFTQDKNHANVYHSPSASSIRGRYDKATSPQTYAVYLNIEKPFDTRRTKERIAPTDKYNNQAA
jgi:hypothetical protein